MKEWNLSSSSIQKIDLLIDGCNPQLRMIAIPSLRFMISSPSISNVAYLVLSAHDRPKRQSSPQRTARAIAAAGR